MRHIPLIISVLMGASASADDHLDIFVNTDVFELEVATDPQISPDGSTIAYVRAANDIMTDSTRNNIWLVNSTAAITGLSYRALPLTPIHAGPMMGTVWPICPVQKAEVRNSMFAGWTPGSRLC